MEFGPASFYFSLESDASLVRCSHCARYIPKDPDNAQYVDKTGRRFCDMACKLEAEKNCTEPPEQA